MFASDADNALGKNNSSISFVSDNLEPDINGTNASVKFFNDTSPDALDMLFQILIVYRFHQELLT